MSTSRRTWCRVCGVELTLPRWKALIGLNHATCDDAVACVTRFRTKREDSVAAGQERRRHLHQKAWRSSAAS